jgi:hypothetical protein
MLGEDREHAGSEMIKLHARDGVSFSSGSRKKYLVLKNQQCKK